MAKGFRSWVDSTKNITVFNTVLSYDDPSRVQETTSVMLIDFENQISKQISTLDYINLLQNLEQWVFFYDNKTYLYEKIVNNGIDEKTSLSNTVPNFSVLSNLDNVIAIKYASIDYKKLFSYDNGKKAYVYTDYSHEEWYIDPNGSMLIEIQFLEYDNYKITKKYLDSQGNIEGLYSYTFTNINTTGSLTIPQYVLDLVQK